MKSSIVIIPDSSVFCMDQTDELMLMCNESMALQLSRFDSGADLCSYLRDVVLIVYYLGEAKLRTSTGPFLSQKLYSKGEDANVGMLPVVD